MSAKERNLTQARAEHLLRSAKLSRNNGLDISADRYIRFVKEILENRRVVDKKKLETMLEELENETSSPLI